MSQTSEDQAQSPKVSRKPLTRDEINLLTQVISILNAHANEKICRHTAKSIVDEVEVDEQTGVKKAELGEK
jgi:hypothetical protein